MELSEKILEHFPGKVVRKDLTARIKGNAVVPTYVLEYLLGQYCAVNDEEIIEKGIASVKEVITHNFVHKAEAELVKSTIREKHSHKIIDKVTVTLNEKSDKYEAFFSNLGIKNVPIGDSVIKKHRKFLSGGGVWCIITIGYDHSEAASSRWIIEAVKPIQVSGVDLEEFRDKRKYFTTDDWLDLLMHSIGLDPTLFNRRGKFIQLFRLITHVENNYNYVELGPKGTGKSHIFSEFSPHGVLVSGGDVTSARLFVNNIGKGQVGLVGYWDVVCLDEFEQVVGSKRADGDMVNIMQNYMANKSFNRGKETIQAYASMAFVGNTKRSVPYMLRNSHMFESIPQAYIKGAFIDRLHHYVPGWEVPILKESFFSKDYGFIVDYLAEILRELRKFDYADIIDKYAVFDSSYTGRDKTAVGKTFSGLVKLIYPHLEFAEEEAYEMIEFGIEGRKRVKDQLYVIDETFRNTPVKFCYTVKGESEPREVETLEKVNYYSRRGKPEESLSEKQEEASVQEQVPELKPSHISIRDNQMGLSYEKIFAPYLIDARRLTLIDPFIRLQYQFRNLLEFCVMLSKIKSEDEEMELKVITWYKDEYMEESVKNFEELEASVIEMGILLSFEFKEGHDRYITTDTGWKILMGRGLDIFEPIEGKFSIASIDQEWRKCKACEVAYVKI